MRHGDAPLRSSCDSEYERAKILQMRPRATPCQGRSSCKNTVPHHPIRFLLDAAVLGGGSLYVPRAVT